MGPKSDAGVEIRPEVGQRLQSAGFNLSPSERRVLRLAAQGRTNEEIASRVFLGGGTVKSHLASAFAKLAAASKTIP
jgi:DNA-binding CsgD family transcriptional regulator